MRHLMSPLDLSKEELDDLLTLASDIEKNPKKSCLELFRCSGAWVLRIPAA